MNTLEAIAKRKSTRSYRPEQISEKQLQTILEAGFAAPVAKGNYESLQITVVQNEAVLAQIFEATTEAMTKVLGFRKNMDFGAKTLLIVSSTPVHRVGMEFANAGIVVENMVLAATDLGVDSVILAGAPATVAKDEALKKTLGIGDGFTPLLGVCLGYGTEQTPAKTHTISVNRI